MADFFNPYAGLAPPACCYCAPLAEPDTININVSTVLNEPGGYGDLAFMTRTEDAFRILEQGRQAEALGLMELAPRDAEMGHGPFSFTRTSDPSFSI